MISTFRKEIATEKNIMENKKPKYYEDLTKSQMVKIIAEQTKIKSSSIGKSN